MCRRARARAATARHAGETDVRAGGAATTTTTARCGAGATFAAVVGDTAGCQTLAGVEPQLLCPIPDGVVDVYPGGEPDEGVLGGRRDRRRSRGARATRRARPGSPTSARGHARERPRSSAGRYFCRVEGARAEIWWTVDDVGLLGHAHRRDDDLVALFSWWRARSEEAPDHP